MARVLLVDDEADVRDLLATVLERASHAVTCAEDGQAALEVLAQGPVDVIVCDIWMPNVDGLSLLKQLKSNNPAARVVVISGGGPGQSLELSTTIAETYGADEVLIKPFRNERIVEAVDACLPPEKRSRAGHA